MEPTRIAFYHLALYPLEHALPQLLTKVLRNGHRAVVMAGSAERVAYLDNLLWTWDPAVWLPHGAVHDDDAVLQPIFITDTDENPNGAGVLVLLDGMVSTQIACFTRCLILFDGRDEEALKTARLQWKQWKSAGFELIYYQQDPNGKWNEKARTSEKTE